MSLRGVRVAMVAYANYYTDARIKNYVDALLDAGASVDVVALGGNAGTETRAGLVVCSLGEKYWGKGAAGYIIAQALFMVKACFWLLGRTFAGRYAVIHAHNMPDVISLVGLPFKLVGTKIVLDIHDTMPEAYATKFGFATESLAVRALIMEERISAACSDKVITTNRLHKEVLVEHGIPAEKIELIYNVGNIKIFKPRRHQLNGRELWLGYHGTIARRLGVFLIVDVLALLKNECPDLRFLCVGEGDDLEEMKSRAQQQGVADLVEFRPFTPVEELPRALHKVQVGIIGNKKETEQKRNYMLPVKMLEYAAMEIPTIAPRLKIIERYFDEHSAFFYEPDSLAGLASVIRSLYQQRSQIATRVEGLRKFNTEYNWNVMATRYLSIIGKLTGRNV